MTKLLYADDILQQIAHTHVSAESTQKCTKLFFKQESVKQK